MSRPSSLNQFLCEIGDIENRLDQYIAVNSSVPIQLPSLPSIPSIPTLSDTTLRSPLPPPPSHDPEADRLSAMLLSVKQDIRHFILTGDLLRLFKYANSNQSELEFVESALRSISQRYSVWSARPVESSPSQVQSVPSPLALSDLHTVTFPCSSSRRSCAGGFPADKIKRVCNFKKS